MHAVSLQLLRLGRHYDTAEAMLSHIPNHCAEILHPLLQQQHQVAHMGALVGTHATMQHGVHYRVQLVTKKGLV